MSGGEIDPRARYRGDGTDCRVQGCSEPGTVVVGTKIQFPSKDAGDPMGRARVNVTLVLCRGHSADLLTALRDREATVSRRGLSESNVRAFERFTKGG